MLSYVFANLRYLINIWEICGIRNFNKIQIAQNKAIKILFKNYRTPTKQLLQWDEAISSKEYHGTGTGQTNLQNSHN